MHWIAGVSWTIGAALLAASPDASAPTTLSPERLQEAIEWGRKAAEANVAQYVLKVAPTWTANFDTPFLRVAQLSRAWTKRERQLKVQDVPEALIKPEVHVYALAMQQPGATGEIKNITSVVLRKPGAMESVSPSTSRSNLNRARGRSDFRPAKIAQSMEVTFSVRDFAPGNELRIFFDDGSYESVILTGEMLAGAR